MLVAFWLKIIIKEWFLTMGYFIMYVIDLNFTLGKDLRTSDPGYQLCIVWFSYKLLSVLCASGQHDRLSNAK